MALLFLVFLLLTLGVDIGCRCLEKALRRRNEQGMLVVVHHLKVRPAAGRCGAHQSAGHDRPAGQAMLGIQAI
jgi:hypothetical protein